MPADNESSTRKGALIGAVAGGAKAGLGAAMVGQYAKDSKHLSRLAKSFPRVGGSIKKNPALAAALVAAPLGVLRGGLIGAAAGKGYDVAYNKGYEDAMKDKSASVLDYMNKEAGVWSDVVGKAKGAWKSITTPYSRTNVPGGGASFKPTEGKPGTYSGQYRQLQDLKKHKPKELK